MYSIRPAAPTDLRAAVEFVTRLQADPAHHIGFHGVTADEVAEELSSLRPAWGECAAVTTDRTGALRALLSADVDPTIGRAWLYGPFVDVPDDHPAARRVWQDAADELLDHVLAHPLLRGARELELFGHRLNQRLGDFAARHCFTTGTTRRVFTLRGAALRAALVSAAPDAPAPRTLDADPAVRADVVALHERIFPGRNHSGARLVSGEQHTVVVLTGADGLIGYAAGYGQENEIYVDYVAVDPNMRSAGAGRDLVRALLRAVTAADGAKPQAAAVVALGNDASERMFRALGFELDLELVPYRLTRTDDIPD